MAKPQKENGYAPLANELLEALAKTNFSPKQGRCIFLLIRKTYGWGRKKAEITTQEWVDGTGLIKTHVYTALRQLIARNVVTRTGHQYGLQKDYTRWREVTRTSLGDQNKSLLGDQNASLSYKNNIKKRQVTRTGHQKQETRHPSTCWITCPHCGACQNTVKKGKPCPWCEKIV